MILVRIIERTTINQLQIDNLEQFGFTLIERGNDVQVWVERADHRD